MIKKTYIIKTIKNRKLLVKRANGNDIDSTYLEPSVAQELEFEGIIGPDYCILHFSDMDNEHLDTLLRSNKW